MSVQDMRAELKLLRSEHPDFMPVSKMKKADISSLLEKMKQHTEITPAVAKTKGDALALKVKAISAEAKESKVAPLKQKAEKADKPMKAEKAMKEKAEEPKKKESIAERMARIREMRKKD